MMLKISNTPRIEEACRDVADLVEGLRTIDGLFVLSFTIKGILKSIPDDDIREVMTAHLASFIQIDEGSAGHTLN